MRFSWWIGSVRSLFQKRSHSRWAIKRSRQRQGINTWQIEQLEERRVLAFDFVSAYVADEVPFFVTNVTTDAVLAESPQQMMLRFTPGVAIDPSSLGGISIVRSGGAKDPFGDLGSFPDQTVVPGAIVVDDFPSPNQIVVRFAETLPDDIYRVSISSAITVDPQTEEETVTGLRTMSGEAFQGGDTFSFDVRLSLGQQVVAVVPQPITREPGDITAGLSQARNVIEVTFDGGETINQSSAETAEFYKLIAIDDATGADIPGSTKIPATVVYDAGIHRARLTFDPGDIIDDALYRLEIGGFGIVEAPGSVAEITDEHDSFGAAHPLGTIDQAGLLVSGKIDPRAEIEMPGDVPTLYYPTPEGTIDEPGHRDVPIDDSNHGLPENIVAPPVPAGQFSIDLSFATDVPDVVKVAAADAAGRWERIILNDLTDSTHPETGDPIDDVLIEIQLGLLGDIASDGEGGIEINENELWVRTAENANPHLPLISSIGLDPADVEAADLEDSFLWAIGQALGFTYSSEQLGVRNGDSFIGANALREYRALGIDPDALAVPLEPEDGSLSGVYWNREVLTPELMTGDNLPQINPLSRLTIGAFEDIGYEVDYSQADPFFSQPSTTAPPSGIIHTIPYNFRSDYGRDPQGNQLQNVITAEQQLRVREIFDLFSRYAGIRFVETAEQGITVATGDTRVISDNTSTTVVRGLARGQILNGEVSADALAIINANEDWGESQYGGAYFREAIRQIGQVIGLWNSYDLPSVMGESLPGENVFPSDYDILHLQQLYPQFGTEIDVYKFKVEENGQFLAETFAQRLTDESSTLDTVLSVYNATGTLVSRNDDSFGRDSRIALQLAAGDYYVAVSSTGNTSFNLDVTNSGFGGRTQGAYDLHLAHTPDATADTTLVDASGTPLDGDRDGKSGGAFNFHFRTAAADETIYVDKISTDALVDVATAVEAVSQVEVNDTTDIANGMFVFGVGIPAGTTVASIDTANNQVTLSASVTLATATKLRFVEPGDGSLLNPYLTIAEALAAVTGTTKIIRVMGNEGSELSGTSNTSGRPSLRPNVLVNKVNPYHYYVGYDAQGNTLSDGANLTVPAGVTLMIDAGATVRLAKANVEVGSSSKLVSRRSAALQVLGTPDRPVAFSSTTNAPEIDPDSQMGQAPTPQGGDWGGIVLRADSDWQPSPTSVLAYETLRPVLNSISNAVISHAGGQVVVDAEVQSFAAIQIEDTRPSVAFSTVTYSAGPAISATPNSFEEGNGRVGPEFRGNTLLRNSTNGVFLAIRTEFGSPLDKLDVSARFASTEVTYVLQESLVIGGGAGAYYTDDAGELRARPSGRLQIDPGVVVKLQNSRIELERGASQLIAEGVGNDRVIFTSFGDNRFGAGGSFDTNGNLPNKFNEDAGWTPNGPLLTGDWGGIVLNAGASASIDNTVLTFGGGEVPLEGGLDDFNVIEVHQADLRLANSRVEANASGLAETARNYRGTNDAATIFVRGAQPIIVGNDFRNNAGAMISVNVNSLNDSEQSDSGRQSGLIDHFEQYDGNRGPLLRGNRISNGSVSGQAVAGLAVRAEEVTVESIWDDTDIVHVVTGEIVVNNFHTATGLRLESDPTSSLVVKLAGSSAGITASGELLDIDDRIGGTVQVVGQPGFPVVLTSLSDDSIGASVDLLGFPVTDTNGDGSSTTPQPGDWRSLQFLPLANDRNVEVINEIESSFTSGQDDNNVVISAEALGILAPNYATGTNTWESAQEKTADENRRQGFEVHGSIAYDDPGDVDIYTFDGHGGSEIWIDIDKTSSSLDTMVELLDASGRVLARSADSQTDSGATEAQSVAGSGVTEVTGFEAVVEGAAAATIGVGSQVLGTEVEVTGAATRATGYTTSVVGLGVQAAQPAEIGDTKIVLVNDAVAVDVGLKAILSRPGVIAPGSLVVGRENNTITLDKPLEGALSAGDWIASDFGGVIPLNVEQPIFVTPPQLDVWVGSPRGANRVKAVGGDVGEVSILTKAFTIQPATRTIGRAQTFGGGGFQAAAFGDAIVADKTGVITEGGEAFYRLTSREVTKSFSVEKIDQPQSRGLTWTDIAPRRWQRISASVDVRSVPPAAAGDDATTSAATVEEGFVFIFQNDGTDVPLPRAAMDQQTTDTSINQVIIHLDNFPSGANDATQEHISVLWGSQQPRVAPLPAGIEIDDNNWKTLEFVLTASDAGVARLTIHITPEGGDTIQLAAVDLPGYSLTADTQFSVGAAGDSTLEEPRPGSLDIDNVRFETIESTGLSSLTTDLGLDLVNPTLAADLLVDNAEAVVPGQTVTGPGGPVTVTSRGVTAGRINAFDEPNEILDEAIQVPISIDDTGLGSSFELPGWVGDNQYGSRDVDLFYLAVPAEARGATITLAVDTGSFDPLVALQNSYLRLFDADGNPLLANDNADGTTNDSRLSFTVPSTTNSADENYYRGRGYFVGVSGAGNQDYKARVVNNERKSGSTGQYLLRGSFDVPFNSVAATVAGEITTSQPVSVTAGQLLPVSLNKAAEVTTAYVTVDDVSAVAVGSQLSGLGGIPAGTRVVAIDPATKTLQLSQPVTLQRNALPRIGFNDTTVTLTNTAALDLGMAVAGSGVPAGTTVTAVVGSDVTLSSRVNVAADQFLQFGFVGTPITTDVLFLDDTAATVGATVSLTTDADTTLADVTAVDAASGAVSLDRAVTVGDGDLLNFSFAGTPITARRVIVDDATGVSPAVIVNTVGAGLLDQRVPAGTTVVDAAVGGGVVELSGPVVISAGEQLGFGFNGLTAEVANVGGVVIGATVTGRGVVPGTTVVSKLPDADPDSAAGTIEFSQPVNVADAVILTFSEQSLNLLEATNARGIAVLPGSLTGTIFVGSTAIQTFAADRDGSLTLAPISNPAARVSSGEIDYQTGEMLLSFDDAPVAPVSIEADYEFGNLGLDTLGFSRGQSGGAWQFGAFPLTKDAYRGGDFYTTNPRDAGMRVILPGTIGQQQKFFVRVRSQPAAGGDRATYEANLRDSGQVAAGLTEGSYELRLRTRQRDDKPGSTVRFADIRYPEIGIDVVGLPNNSPLVGTTGETVVDANNSFATAQQVGNLLTSDRNTISIAGDIATEGDIDWYQFSLTYEDIQSISGHNDGSKTWATVFDIDYADGFRGDLTLSVFDAVGRLIYVGRDSNIADDQPGLGQGNDFDDLSRGSVGALDPFIGSVQLEAGSTTLQTYYVAVSSNERLPAALDGTFEAAASDPLARLEPVNSVRRVVEDHIGSTGYTTHNGRTVSAAGIINTGSALELAANVRPFTLSDVTLYVSTSSALYTHDPFTGDRIATINTSYSNGAVGDIDMRTDGQLYQYASIGSDGRDDGINIFDGPSENEGKLRRLDTGTGAVIYEQQDGITGLEAGRRINGSLTRPYANNSDAVDALAIRRTGTGQYNTSTFYAVRDSVETNHSRLYRVDSVGVFGAPTQIGNTSLRPGSLYAGVIQGAGIVGVTTGMQHLDDSDQLYGVNAAAQFYSINESNAAATLLADFSELVPEGFQGLAAAPVNLYGGRFQNMFFAITGTGRLVVIDPDGAADGSPALIDNVFDTNSDGIADSYISRITVTGATGLAFSPLDVNLWHPTNARWSDDGHGIDAAVDRTRFGNFGGLSMYFGLDGGRTEGSYRSYGQGGQYGVFSNSWQADLLANPEIAQTYNLPGGAHGSLITNSFSLAGYSYTDKPTLYFNYFLETEAADGFFAMRDSARVFASTDGGLTWSLLATNNSQPNWELPPAQSVSSRIGEAADQLVQELYDNTGTWRQARVDLGEYAGAANIQLRFDFATAGEFDTSDISQGDTAIRRTVMTGGGSIGSGDSVIASTPIVPLDSVSGLAEGMTVRRSIIEQITTLADNLAVLDATIRAIDPENRTITLDRPISELQNGEELSFFQPVSPKNNILGRARTSGDNTSNNRLRGVDNRYEGFYIDDIIVGFAERGEMVTGATDGLTRFYDVRTPELTGYPRQTLTGEYQLEIRRGTEYASTIKQTADSESYLSPLKGIDAVYDTNDRLVANAGRTQRVLRENSLAVIDGADLLNFGNGRVRSTGSAIRLEGDPAQPVGVSSNSMLAWYVDLADQPAAVLNYAVELSDREQVNPLPNTFIFNAWKAETTATEVVDLPVGDGVAVSKDGGENWQTIDNFAWTGRRTVDLIAEVGQLTTETVIGFFRQGRAVGVDQEFIEIRDLSVTTAPPERRTGTVGDANNGAELVQGQFVVVSNIITDAERYGVRVEAGRDTGSDPYENYSGVTNAPHLGVARNLPVLNNAGLVPGVVVNNNVISRSGIAGLEYRGERGDGTQPASVVPYGRIFNNTIVGGGQGFTQTIGLPTTLLSGTYAEGGSVLRARIDTEFREITSITLRDSGNGAGLDGAVSGLDVDAIALSGSFIANAGAINTIPVLDVFSFDAGGARFTAGSQSGQAAADLQGTTKGEIDFTKATLGAFDRTDSPLAGVVSLGNNGSIRFILNQPLAVSGPLYVYFGEGAAEGEALADGIEVTGTLRDSGIRVRDAAGPTILNNVFADLGTAVVVDDSSKLDATGSQRTVISTSAFYNVGTQVDGASQTQGITLSDDPFVDAAAGNFYPVAQSPIVDSSLNSLQDRNAYTVVTQPLGIAPSPIVTPPRDLFGQLRDDDPDQASAPGLGLNVFKDRGAIERIDRSAPTARLVSPLDQAAPPLDDKNADLDSVRLEGREARGLQQFVIQLDDIGVGLDRASVNREAAALFHDGNELAEGTDYFFQFNANTNQIILASTVAFPLGDYLIELRPDVAERRLVDLAGNPLRANASANNQQFTSFLISLDDVPTAPRRVGGVSGDGNAELSWLPSNTAAGNLVTEYQVEYSDDGGDNWASVSGGTTQAGLITVDLPNNLSRLFRVRAKNDLGFSPYSAVFAAAPSEPRSVTAEVNLDAEETASLSWTVPINSGVPIGRYAIDRSTDDGETWARVATAAGDATAATVTGLSIRQLGGDAGQRAAVTFRIAAETTAGQGAWSQQTAAIIPEGRPDAPSELTGTFNDETEEVELTWTVPYDGEQPIDDYIVSINGAYQSNEQIEVVNDTMRRTSITGLERGQTYLFAVRAANSYGVGGPSGEFVLELPTSAASPPRNLEATPGNEKVTVTWDSPAALGGLPLDGYRVEFATSSFGPWILVEDAGPTDQEASVAPLARNTEYWFQVAAVNSEGIGGYAKVGPVIPSGTPAVPSGAVSVTAITPPDGTIDLSWVYNPEPTGEQEVTGYDIYQRINGEAWPELPIVENLAGTTRTVLSGLDNGTAYDFRVVATNAEGSGAEGQVETVIPRVPADPPTDLTLAVRDGSVEVAWVAPVSNGGTAITDYEVQYSSDAGQTWQDFADGESASLSVEVENLTNGQFYRFRARALTDNGGLAGAWSAETSDVESIGLPAAPSEVIVTPVTTGAGGVVDVSWITPTTDGGRPIEGYVVQYAESNGVEVAEDDWQDFSGNVVDGSNARVENLVNGQAYVFRVAAVTAHTQSSGSLVFSATTAPVTVRGQLPGPIDLQSNATQSSITLTWNDPPEGFGGATAVNYEVEISLGDQSMTKLTSGARWTTFSGLPSGTTFSLRVRAVLAGGAKGDWSFAHEAETA